ncbi:hypothetical protein KAM351_27110 [Aeromonas caviae]|uniref:Uncharacterized protein n=1 Tax=Aeromonas caviae TaxID=648 RepID=A0AA37FVG0_AERCA|nr:hypothetical protein [Aeromonas caviae]GJA64100.1 hypothetical protein KAM351_27110 [Aeromonas caviae]
MRKQVDMSKLRGTGSSATLIERDAVTADTEKKSKVISFPVTFEARHKALKAAGATSLLYSQYIVEALREKLERDEQQS